MSDEQLHVFKIDDGNESYWFAVASLQEALDEYLRMMGYEDLEDARREMYLTADEPTVTQEPDDKPFTVANEDPDPGEPEKQTLTCAEWVAKKGRQFWCTTAY